MIDDVDCVVIGAGVVGLAIARALARAGRETLILEKEAHFGAGTSSRNSEVIHAGIYYPPGSLKARLCVRGKEQIYAFCEAFGVQHSRCGKLIVAASQDQEATLYTIAANAKANGVGDLEWLGRDRVATLEPELACQAALISPSTGIIDSHAYMLALLGDAERHGALIAYNTEVTGIEPTPGGLVLKFGAAREPYLRARVCINSAGLDAVRVASVVEGFPASAAPDLKYARGVYFTLGGRTPFSRLIYPVPVPGGLGVHLTLDLAGRGRFGPDVEWIEAPSYDVDPRRAEGFYAAIRSYWPALPDGALAPGYAGVRPKLAGPGEPDQDFRISTVADHGVAGLINLFGIESPGLTASLAIADEVLALTSASS